MTAIVLDSVSKTYDGRHRVIDGLRLRVEDGEFLVLLGPSGCGKSTILRMIAGLEDITEGRLWLGDTLANDLPPRDRHVAMVFQHGALYPHRSVRRNLAFPLEIAGGDQDEIHQRVVELARVLGLEQTLDRAPSTLSGGQRQRVAMGRAIIREPELFLMDEPLSNLDAAMRTDLRLEIGALVRSLGITTVYVTHDQVEALTLADRVAVLRDGVLEDLGTPAQVHDDPATAFVAAFLGAQRINLLRGTVWASAGQGVVLDLGGQQIFLPWTDDRTRLLAPHHGTSIVVGIRADTLRPTGDPNLGTVLSGQLRAAEYHGHEWIAHVEAGVTVVDGMEIGRPRAATGGAPGPRRGATADRATGRLEPGSAETASAETASDGAGRAVVARLRSLARRRGVASQAEPEHIGTHRRSELLVRLESGHGWEPGSPIHLTVDVSRLLLFDRHGRRIDTVLRRTQPDITS